MPTTAGTIERIGIELGDALSPLQEILGPDIFDRLGVVLPQSLAGNGTIKNKFTAAANTAKNFQPQINALTAAITAEDTGGIISASINLVSTIVEFVVRMAEAGDAIGNATAALPAADKTAVEALAAEMGTRILEYVAVGYFDKKLPNVTPIINLLGIIDKEHKPASDLDITNVPTDIIPRRFRIERIPKLFMDPKGFLDDVFKWGGNAATFKGDQLLYKILALLESIGIPGAIYEEAGDLTLEAYFFSLGIKEAGGKAFLAFNFSLPGSVEFKRDVRFSDLWLGTVDVKAGFAAGLDVEVHPPFEITALPPTGNVELETKLGLEANKSDGSPIDILSFTGGSKLSVQKIAAALGMRANFGTSGGQFVPTLSVDLTGGKLIIDFSQGDGFIQKILSSIKLDADFSLGADWDPENGVRFRGDAGIEILLPLHIDLSVIVIDGLYFKIGISNDIPIQIGLATKFSANLGPLKAVVEKIGINVNFKFPSDGKGNLGMVDVGFGFKPPNGVGLSLDVGVVRGGGYLYFDFDKEEYAGVLELSIAEIVTVKAIALITTRCRTDQKDFHY